MEEPWGMRLWFFVLSFVLTLGFACHGMTANSFSGELIQLQGNLFLSLPQKCNRYRLLPKNNEASAHLRKLGSGDVITATGLLDHQNCQAFVESVEYVGLRRLLGYWYSKSGIITVRDYSSLSFYPVSKAHLPGPLAEQTGDPITYRYSVTPSGGKEWVVFLSNAQGTSFATLRFAGRTVTMKIFDPETGDLHQTLRLSKWGELKP